MQAWPGTASMTRDHTPKEKWLSPSQQLLGLGWSPMVRDPWGKFEQLGHVQVTTAAAISCGQGPCHVQKSAFHSSPPHPLASTFFLPYLPWCSLSIMGRRKLLLVTHLMAEHSASPILGTLTSNGSQRYPWPTDKKKLSTMGSNISLWVYTYTNERHFDNMII